MRMPKNKTLSAAKNDEFYTQYADIQKQLQNLSPIGCSTTEHTEYTEKHESRKPAIPCVPWF